MHRAQCCGPESPLSADSLCRVMPIMLTGLTLHPWDHWHLSSLLLKLPCNIMQVRLKAAAAPVLRALAAAITLGSGASLGPEGPSVDIGRSAARALGSVLRSRARRLLPLIAAGSGAGVSGRAHAAANRVHACFMVVAWHYLISHKQ